MATVVKGVFTSSITLSGTGQASDGQAVLGAGEKWLVTANGVDNGVWVTAAGDWTRTPELDAPTDFVWGAEQTIVRVKGGSRFPLSTWQYNGADNPILGADTLYFEATNVPRDEAVNFGIGFDVDGSMVNHANSNVTPGSYSFPGLITVNATGHTTNIESSGAFTAYLEGCALRKGAGSRQIIVGPGSFWAPGLKRFVELGADFPVNTGDYPSGNGLGMWHLYGYEVDGAGIVEASDVGPATPYRAFARTFPGDDTRRYLGSVPTQVSSTIQRVEHELDTGLVLYKDHWHATLQLGPITPATQRVYGVGVVAGADGTAWNFVPTTSSVAYVRARMQGTGEGSMAPNDFWIDPISGASAASMGQIRVSSSRSYSGPLQLDDQQRFKAVMHDVAAVAPSGIYVEFAGYYLRR